MTSIEAKMAKLASIKKRGKLKMFHARRVDMIKFKLG